MALRMNLCMATWSPYMQSVADGRMIDAHQLDDVIQVIQDVKNRLGTGLLADQVGNRGDPDDAPFRGDEGLRRSSDFRPGIIEDLLGEGVGEAAGSLRGPQWFRLRRSGRSCGTGR